MKSLANNTVLHSYLLSLADLLANGGYDALAESVRFAVKQGAGLSTEFLGEALIALRRVQDQQTLEAKNRHELSDVIEQIQSALRR